MKNEETMTSHASRNNGYFDLIIVGGGIYGVMLALEAARRRQKALLLEKGDFGSATSLQHLRTLHGGLRYLQTLDLPRFFESVGERKWFLRHFAPYTQALPCMMPLYGRGIYRKAVFRPALWLNDLLSFQRNRRQPVSRHLPNGYILGREQTIEYFPGVKKEGLKGAAVWFDGAMPDHHRIFFDLLLNACRKGATALNYTEVTRLLADGSKVKGVRALDHRSRTPLRFHSPVVINAAGPDCRDLARKFDRDYPELFRQKLRLWNILFRRKALSDYALALMPRGNSGHTYFIHNWKGRLLAGTGETPMTPEEDRVTPSEEEIRGFIDDLNRAIPDLGIREGQVEHVYSGIIPGDGRDRLAKREVILDHGRSGGPVGLYSVSGVKFTTARRVAEKTLRRVSSSRPDPYRFELFHRGTYDYHWVPGPRQTRWLPPLRQIMEQEAVLRPEDLVYRRTDLAENTRRLEKLLPAIRSLFPTD